MSLLKNIPPTRKKEKVIDKTNVKSPRCHPKKLYKFNKQAN